MAQSGFTPISLYHSSTPSAAPSAGNLVSGELALNIADGKLYFKNSSNVVTLLADSIISGLTLPLSVGNGGTGLTTLATGRIPYGNGTGAFQSSSSLLFDGTTLEVGPGALLGGATNPFLAVTGNTNQYIQQYIYNANSGTSASSDFAAYPDNGSDSSGYIDLGISSSTYADTAFSCTTFNEGYILMSAPSGAGNSGNLVYATDSTGTTNSHQWYIGGFNQAKSAWKMQLTATGLQLANALSVAYGGTGATATPTNGQLLIGNGTNFTVATLGSGTGISTTTGAGTLQINNTAPMVYPSGSGIAVVASGTSWGTTLTAPTGAIVGTTDTQTLTNKRVTPRVNSITSAATITPTSDLSDQYNVTALATTATFAIPSGTPTDGQKLSIRIYAGTTQTISWTTSAGGYRAIGVTLPTTITGTKTTYVGCVYNSADGFWDVVAVATQA